jgi:hypothetical protein
LTTGSRGGLSAGIEDDDALGMYPGSGPDTPHVLGEYVTDVLRRVTVADVTFGIVDVTMGVTFCSPPPELMGKCMSTDV